MSTGPREGNIVDGSDDDSHLPSELWRSENLESQDVGSACGENEGWSQLDSDGNVVQVDEEGSDVEQPLITDEGGDGGRRRTEFSLPPTTISTPVTHTKKKKKHCNNDFRDLLNRSMQQREERARQRAEDRRKLLEETKNTDDPLFNFFMSMYQLTKTMPHQYQHRVRAHVFQAVSDAEAEIMNTSFNQSPSTFSSSHDSRASSTALHSPYQTRHPSPHTSSYSQHITPIHHAHQMEQEPENLPIDSSQPNSSSLANFINNYQCNN
jgi:hypothetical protein